MTSSIVTRRDVLRGLALFSGWAFAPRLVSAAGGRDPRFLFIILRGALDGLATVAPVGDPDYESARGGLIIPTRGSDAGLPLGNFFALNPNMPALHAALDRGDATIVHATSTPYRERSHFDGQDVLESGQPGPGRVETGWLNRLIGTLQAGEPVRATSGLALSEAVPLVMRGPQKVVSWTPAGFPDASDDTRLRLLDLYTHTDVTLARLLEDALALDDIAGAGSGMGAMMAQTAQAELSGMSKRFSGLAASAGRLLAQPAGPRIAALSYPGWDTHRGQGLIEGRLANLLTALDTAIDALHRELQPVWRDTAIVIATEFGRAVAMNGTMGTDHGTGTIAIVLGGAVNGGRVVADWPGLSQRSLLGGRDLMPTTDLRAVLKGVAKDHLGLGDRELAEIVFPDSAGVRPLSGLIA
ncbi:MAG TPA: DUF1501 domain-containing protein [Aestuariivirgaceae bacterium]|nr:DUF1501 domain-containing protein [Aestuariivirgaceae bacterium]